MDEVHFSDTEVLEALSQLKSHKFNNDVLSSEHLKLASPAIAKHLAVLFTSVVRHWYLPRCLSDCVLIPIPKSNKDASCSSNYCAIALASTLSKTLEHFSYFSTSLQFGFKPGSSTTLCTGVVKNVISRYIHKGSQVMGCFLNASKAFDLVKHEILSQKLLSRGLPLPVIRFLSSWYRQQHMRVYWDQSLSESFHVSNGVRQGSVLSPLLFSIYLDDLLNDSGVGCHFGIVLLAPCASALRILRVCLHWVMTQ